ncbi:MAG: methyltransferase domain-containing protein [Thermoleophilaceae bacterium]
MAVTATTAEFLAEARRGGADFASTLTIGRQATFVGPIALGATLRRNGLWPAGETRRDFMRRFADGPPWFADPYLRLLGAHEVRALDVSAYEGADIVHDLNEPVPAELEGRFDVVFDGGSLEHVFDVAAALRNYMRMVRVGGRLIVATMADNHCGHGFYQLSPELFFRALSEPSGYRVERLHLAGEELDFSRPIAGVSLVHDTSGGGRWAVADPEAVRERVLVRGRGGVVLLVEARRLADVAPLAEPPQQSDYEPLWSRPGAAAGPIPDADAGPLRSAFRRLVPPEARMAIALDLAPRLLPLLDPLRRRRTARRRSFRNRRHFRRL